MGTINYHRNGEVIEIIVRDFSGAKIETYKCTVGEKKKYRQILQLLKEKYDFAPEVDIQDSVNKDTVNWWD